MCFCVCVCEHSMYILTFVQTKHVYTCFFCVCKQIMCFRQIIIIFFQYLKPFRTYHVFICIQCYLKYISLFCLCQEEKHGLQKKKKRNLLEKYIIKIDIYVWFQKPTSNTSTFNKLTTITTLTEQAHVLKTFKMNEQQLFSPINCL